MRSAQNRRAYTLVELLVAMTASTILMSGLASALYISSHALGESGASRQSGLAGVVLNDMMADLRHAKAFTDRTNTAVSFTVPDRNGDSTPELIRYAWSGVVGAPLIYQYNGGTLHTIARDVQYFNVSALTRDFMATGVTPGGTNVLLVVVDAASLTSQETARKSLLDGWGYTVNLITASDSQESYNTAISANTVVYISTEISAPILGTKLKDAPIGVVNEELDLTDDFGFSSDKNWPIELGINITDNSHHITTPFSIGLLMISTTDQGMSAVEGTLAADLQPLGNFNGVPSLACLAPGASLYGGGTAAGRRVQLPWGDADFDINLLTDDGRTLLERSIAWAAGAGDAIIPSGVVFESFADQQQSTNATSIFVPVPAGTSTGDLLIAAVVTDGDAGGINASNGWTPIDYGQEAGSVSLGVWWKLASAPEPANYSFNWAASEKSYGWIMRFTGHDAIAPIHVTDTGAGASSFPTSPAVTTTVDNCLILRVGGFDDDDVTNGDAGVGGHTTIAAGESNDGTSSCSGAAAQMNLSTAGDSSSADFTLGGSEQYRTLTIAIAPDAS